MILQALYQLAKDEALMPDPDYQWKAVAWRVRVDGNGRLLGIEGTHETIQHEEGKKKFQERPKAYRIPCQPKRSGKKAPPYFLVDNALYVFGHRCDDKSFSEEDVRRRATWFRNKVADCAARTKDEGVSAVLRLLEDIAAGRQKPEIQAKTKSYDLFAFIYAPDVDRFVTEREAVRDYWKADRNKEKAGCSAQNRCLVTGKLCVGVDKHPPVKNVPGGQGDTSLVSFNKSAFWSYGWRNHGNAVISLEASDMFSTALNRLLDNAPPDPNHPGSTLPRRNLSLGEDTKVCYWAPGRETGDFLDCLSALLQGNPEEVKELYRSIWRGKSPRISGSSRFYAMTLSRTARVRITVRDWFESTVAEVADHLAQHFADLDIVRNARGDLPLRMPLNELLESLAPPSENRQGKIPPQLSADFIQAGFKGTAYALSLLERALLRYRAEVGKEHDEKKGWQFARWNDARAALIKAVLNRRKRFHSETTGHYKEVRPDMDATNNSPGYLLGRLMAVIERMQQAASPEVNTTVVDRFFSGASATPVVVFPRLLRGMRHHASKAKDDKKGAGTARWLEGQADAIVSGLGGFPAFLPLEEQGLFVLGYHHQRHWLWMSKEAREEQQADRGETAAAQV